MTDSFDENLIEKLESFLSFWKAALNTGNNPSVIADQLFHAETGEALGWNHPAYSSFIDFCDFFTYCTKDRYLSSSEIIAIAHLAKQSGVEIENSRALQMLRKAVAPKKWWQFWK